MPHGYTSHHKLVANYDNCAPGVGAGTYQFVGRRLVLRTSPARFVQRVGGALRAAQERDGQIRIRLSPPELGTLRIEIAVKQGVLTAQLETDTVAAHNLILDNLPALRERLTEQEIRIEKFDVNVRDENSP